MAKKKSTKQTRRRRTPTQISASEVLYSPPPRRSNTGKIFLYLLLAAILVAGVFFLLKSQGTFVVHSTSTTVAAGESTTSPSTGGSLLSTILPIVLGVLGLLLLGFLFFFLWRRFSETDEERDERILNEGIEKGKEIIDNSPHFDDKENAKKNEIYGSLANLEGEYRGKIKLNRLEKNIVYKAVRLKIGNPAYNAFYRLIGRDLERQNAGEEVPFRFYKQKAK